MWKTIPTENPDQPARDGAVTLAAFLAAATEIEAVLARNGITKDADILAFLALMMASAVVEAAEDRGKPQTIVARAAHIATGAYRITANEIGRLLARPRAAQ